MKQKKKNLGIGIPKFESYQAMVAHMKTSQQEMSSIRQRVERLERARQLKQEYRSKTPENQLAERLG